MGGCGGILVKLRAEDDDEVYGIVAEVRKVILGVGVVRLCESVAFACVAGLFVGSVEDIDTLKIGREFS